MRPPGEPGRRGNRDREPGLRRHGPGRRRWPAGSEPLKSTWSGRAIAALVIPALILLVVWLL